VASFISVTAVNVTKDLRHAKIFVSIFGKEEEQAQTLLALSRAAGFIRGEVGRRIRLRHTPEIAFQLDQSIAYGAHINQLLRELNPSGGDQAGE